MNLLINPKTEKLIKGYVSKPNSSLLLLGKQYSGVEQIATNIAEQLLNSSNKNNIVYIQTDESTIGIDMVRNLKEFTISKNKGINRVIIIIESEKLTVEAQNSLLKMIEEPVEATALILTSGGKEHLLPTIQSRCQKIEILPITTVQKKEFLKDYNKDDVNTAYIKSRGYYNGFINSLNGTVTNDTITDAKEYLKLDVYERLNLKNKYTDRIKLSELIEDLLLITEAGLHSKNNTENWKKKTKTIIECKQNLSYSSVKLIYLKLSLNL